MTGKWGRGQQLSIPGWSGGRFGFLIVPGLYISAGSATL